MKLNSNYGLSVEFLILYRFRYFPSRGIPLYTHVESFLFQVRNICNIEIHRLHVGYRLSALRRLQLPSAQLRLLSEASVNTVDATKLQSAALGTPSAKQSGSAGGEETPKRKKSKVGEKDRFDK